MYRVGDEVNTTEGLAIIQRIYSDGELALSFPRYMFPDELFTMAPIHVSPILKTKSTHTSRYIEPVGDEVVYMYRIGDEVNTTEGLAIIQRIYSDGELALSFPSYVLPDELFTMAPVDVSPLLNKRRKPTVDDEYRPNKRRKPTLDDEYRPNKLCKTTFDDEFRPLTRKRHLSTTDEHESRTTMYTKDRTPTVSKTQQNTSFLAYLQTLDIPMKKLIVLVLDTSMLRTTRLLLDAGLLPSHIYIPQPDMVEAAMMLEQFPTLKVFAGIKAGDLVWELADRPIRLHGALLDYCGAPGKVGRKNMPADDVANLFRYNLLADHAVLTQTICARSCVRVTQKYEGLKYLVKTIENCARRLGRRLYKSKEIVYTDPGSQTMCHFRCIVSKRD